MECEELKLWGVSLGVQGLAPLLFLSSPFKVSALTDAIRCGQEQHILAVQTMGKTRKPSVQRQIFGREKCLMEFT